MIDLKADLDIDLDADCLDIDLDSDCLDLGLLDADFSEELGEFDANIILDSDPTPDESASIADPVAAIQAALARATPFQISSARKTVAWLDRRL
jgi:hypothetical protein